ncbi:hypothetical protein HYY73_00350 [Candidatus Woesearchaeota archaeon]|nr:hypothetical protein [Candidatus Woesearchaeota archaeon]
MKKGKLRKGVGKKGASTVTIVRAFGIAMAAFIIVVLIQYWRDIKNDTFLEKNYLARDISLLITAAYASPGELTYCYYLTPPQFNYCHSLIESPPPLTSEEEIAYCANLVGNSNKFDYLIEKSKVTVVDSGQPFVEGGAVYYYADSKASPVQRVEISGKDSEDLVVLQIVKDSNGVKVLHKKVGEDAKPCKP